MRHMLRYLYAFPRDRCTNPSKPIFTNASVGTEGRSDLLVGVHRHPCSAVYISPSEQFPHPDAGVVVHCIGAGASRKQACC